MRCACEWATPPKSSSVSRSKSARAALTSADVGPYTRERDRRVAAALSARGVAAHFLDSPYAVEAGVVSAANGDPCWAATPFRRAWSCEAVPHLGAGLP
ncbi:MAG: deoxyribodipyrimidine photo-lyase [Acidimicrobiales bacterium]